jgi:hypothetical protein
MVWVATQKPWSYKKLFHTVNTGWYRLTVHLNFITSPPLRTAAQNHSLTFDLTSEIRHRDIILARPFDRVRNIEGL